MWGKPHTGHEVGRAEALFVLADEWRSAAYEFEDKKLRAAFAKLRTRAQRFVDLVSTCTYRRGDLLSPKTDQDFQGGTTPQTRNRMREMNEAGRALLAEIEAVYRLARRVPD